MATSSYVAHETWVVDGEVWVDGARQYEEEVGPKESQGPPQDSGGSPLHECDAQTVCRVNLETWKSRDGSRVLIKEEVRMYRQDNKTGRMYVYHKRIDTLVMDFETRTFTILEYKRRRLPPLTQQPHFNATPQITARKPRTLLTTKTQPLTSLTTRPH
jgi:hypothetical protein